MKDDQLYFNLYVQRRRLMSQNAQKNQECCNLLAAEIKALRDHGEVSQTAIELAPYLPWR